MSEHDERFVPQTLPPAADFLFQNVPPSAPMYMGREDRLRVLVFNEVASINADIYVRHLGPDGVVQITKVTEALSSDRTVNSIHVDVGEGFLFGVSVFTDGATTDWGQTYGALEIRRGDGNAAVTVQTLASGYFTNRVGLSFPHAIENPAVNGPGRSGVTTGTDAAAGAELSESVPSNSLMRINAFTATLVTGAVAGNRTPNLYLDDGTNVFAILSAGVSIGISTTQIFCWASANLRDGTKGNAIFCPLPEDLVLPAGGRVRTVTDGLDASDNWGAPVIHFNTWHDR